MAAGGRVSVTRAQVLDYRVAAQELRRTVSNAGDLAVLDIGVQEAMGHPSALAFANRLSGPVGPASVAVGAAHPLAMTWSVRGAPHVHRRQGLHALAGGLWPLSEADAAGRLNETGPSVARAGIPALEQFALVVHALHDAVPAPTEKGAVSTAVTAALPEPMRRPCRPCGTAHVSDSALRAAALGAGIELEPGTSPPVLAPRARAHPPDALDATALTALVRAYLTVLGPATVGDVAGYLGVRRRDLDHHLPGGLTEVHIDGRAALLPEEHLDALITASDEPIVRLLGPFDPYLQARDRDLLVPAKADQKALWPVLGRPGAVLVDGEIAGTWRAKASTTKLTITVSPFDDFRAAAWDDLEAEAGVVARARGASAVTVRRA